MMNSISQEAKFCRRRERRWSRGLLVTALFVLGTCSDTYRIDSVANGQERSQQAASGLAYVPRDALVVIALKPADLQKRPCLAPLGDVMPLLARDGLGVAMPPEEIGAARIVLLTPSSTPTILLILEFATPEGAKRIIAAQPGARQVSTLAGQPYFHSKGNAFFFQPAAQTLVLASDEATILRSLAAGVTGASTTKWAEQWPRIANLDAAVIVSGSLVRADPAELVRESLVKILNSRPGKTPSMVDLKLLGLMKSLGTLSQHSDYSLLELHAADDLRLRFATHSASDELAAKTLNALLTTVADIRNRLSHTIHSLAAQPDAANLERIRLMDGIDETLENATLTRQDSQIELVATLSEAIAQHLASEFAAPAIAAREATVRQPSIENLERIGKAFRDHVQAHKQFPAAIQVGPGSVRQSWRVSILPYLGYRELFHDYRKDEPWDSAANKKVLAQMPEVYRCPADKTNSTNTGYFVFIGQETVLSAPSTRRHFAHIRDGSSNTILAVESKHRVPWTKPDDIRFDSKAPLPRLGGWYPGGFYAVMFDGKARFFPDSMDSQNVKHLITPSAGDFAQLPEQ